MPALETYKEIIAAQSDVDTVKQLRQPERHVLLSFKVFKYLMERCGQLEERIAALEAGGNADRVTKPIADGKAEPALLLPKQPRVPEPSQE